MNILIMPSWYPNKIDSINGCFFREQALALLKTGNRIIVLDTTLQGKRNYFSKDTLRHRHYWDDGLEVFSFLVPALGIARTEGGGEVLYEFISLIEFRRVLRAVGKIDVIHAHSFLPAGMAACRIGKRMGIPTVVTEHSSGVLLNRLGTKRKELLIRTVQEANQFICVSNKLKEAVLEITNADKDIEVIPNSVSSLFTLALKHNAKDSFVFLSIGRLEDNKRFDLTIKAFVNVFKSKKNIKLKIIGDGKIKGDLEALIQSLGREEQIELVGALTREQIAEKLQTCDVFVLPSAFETFGVVYIEALACGVPVIGSRNGGAEDIINNNNGVLIDVDNQIQLETAMLYMYNNIDKYDKQKISTECTEKYGEDIIAKQLLELYKNI